MLAERIHDDVESRRGTVEGLGLLPIDIAFAAEKRLATPDGTAFGTAVRGYEIHHGRVVRRGDGLAPLITTSDGLPEGAAASPVFGTHWHGAFECDEFRRAFLTEAARLAGRRGFTVAPDTRFGAARERTLDLLGDLVEAHLDTDALWRLIDEGPQANLPVVPPAGSRLAPHS